MDDEEGKGAAASESTAVGLDVDGDVGAADAQAKASTSAAASTMQPTRPRTPGAQAVAAESSTSTSTSTTTTSSTNAAAAAETAQDGDDAGTKMNPHVSHTFRHSSDQYVGGGASGGAPNSTRRPLPMSLPARSSNSFTPINSYSCQDDHLSDSSSHNNNTGPTLPPIGSINSLPPPQPQTQSQSQSQAQTQAPRQRTSLPTARPTSSTTSTTSVPYYPGHTEGRLLPSNYGINPREMAQYALLPPEPKAFQRQAPKKEIKRRTKTGCMTCRKRRIKCDEAHPSCNNCKKSKRECLGYDPVFREQSIPGHSNTASNSNLRSSPAPSSPSSRGPTTPNSHVETIAAPRLETPNVPETAGRPLPTAAPYIAPEATREPYDYWTLVIESLHYPIVLATDEYKNPSEGSLPPIRVKSEPTEPSSRSGTFFDPVTAAVSERREASAATEAFSNGHSTIQRFEERRFRLPGIMRVGDLINGFGTSAPPLEPVQTEEIYQEVVKVYHEMYASGLSALFESTWFYFTDDGKMSFPRTGNTAGHVAAFLKLIKGANIQDHAFMAHCSVVELRLVWELAKLAANAAPDKADNRMRVSLPPENDAIEVKNRFSVVDALLGGDFLPWNPLTPSTQDANPHREREFDFWHQLGEFLRWNADKDSAEEDQRRQDTIDRMRWLLDGRENRDVLYSIVVLRHYTSRFDMTEAMKAKYHLPEEEAKNRVVVASKFIGQQAQVTGGTTSVIRRICDVAARLFVHPNDNARRGAPS